MNMKTKIITIEPSDLAILILHLHTMRNSIKKGLKRNYGAFEGKKKIKVFDEMKKLFSETFEQENENGTELNMDQLDMIQSFIEWYIEELYLEAEDEGIDYKENESILALERVKEQVKSNPFVGEIDRIVY
jgi:competence CoiA-like predicted nuclease